MEPYNPIASFSGVILHRIGSLYLPQFVLDADRVYYHQTRTDQTIYELLCTFLIHTTASFILISIVDFCIARPVTYFSLRMQKLPTQNYVKTSWFLLHFLFNMSLVANTIQDVVLAVLYPITEMYNPPYWRGTHPGGLLAGGTMGTFHLHHLVWYWSLCNREDMFHHSFSFAAVLVGGLVSTGRIATVCMFTMCGIAGGLNYLVLWLVKCDLVHSLTQKQFNRVANMGIRYPVQMFGVFACVAAHCEGDGVPARNAIETVLGILIVGLCVFNAIYYCDQVVGNYHVTHYVVRQKDK